MPVADSVKQGGYVLERSVDRSLLIVISNILSCVVLASCSNFSLQVSITSSSLTCRSFYFGLSLPFLLLNEVDLAL